MAEEGGEGGGELGMLVFVFGGFAVLVALWFMAGGPSRSDLRGIFIHPPTPLGPGGAYGPAIKETTSTKPK